MLKMNGSILCGDGAVAGRRRMDSAIAPTRKPAARDKANIQGRSGLDPRECGDAAGHFVAVRLVGFRSTNIVASTIH